ncbi:polysaccharide pyruvyl transferase family protein [Aliivibrio fischeri]|uniref:polysaccharide pyruvyl transferase family protein n=1 Tax=Aliivibrio fischeri TaxID=668 RepID=UPI001F15BEBA|nr:polysaccharide pyruvyl transferase family protein [Aliivibrio fischeri]MCE7536794.1 polysaccharide pyruvyl transferase family protein [Aliivibrio fischeri]MCE7560490.1 polysaccharide pyruvyl transferase family protein [Aliivibrio fischeri]
MDSLKAQHAEIAKLIDGRKVAYIDIPMYFNVGDLLIYKGTEAFFKDYNINVTYRGGDRIDEKHLNDADVILYQGGGNFGDLYDKHQNIRERIIAKFTNKCVICLPQSIHFEKQAALKKSADIFRKHQDFHFFVRDHESVEVAKEFTNNVYLTPDMAHSLHPLIDKRECVSALDNSRNIKIINMKRVDSETSVIDFNLDKKGFDWLNIITLQDTHYRRLLEIFYKCPIARKKVMNYWEILTNDIVFKSINHFHAHDLIYTNRLHGFILSTLLGKQLVLNDNSYGKNHRYFKAFMSDYPFIIHSS